MNAIIAAVPGLFFTAFFFYAAAFYYFQQVSFSLGQQLYIAVLAVHLVAPKVLVVLLAEYHAMDSSFVTSSVWLQYSRSPPCENPNTFVTEDTQIFRLNILVGKNHWTGGEMFPSPKILTALRLAACIGN